MRGNRENLFLKAINSIQSNIMVFTRCKPISQTGFQSFNGNSMLTSIQYKKVSIGTHLPPNDDDEELPNAGVEDDPKAGAEAPKAVCAIKNINSVNIGKPQILIHQESSI